MVKRKRGPVRLRRYKLFIILSLGLLSAIGPFSIDMYLPGFPAIAADLGTDEARIALSLSGFYIGLAFGQFVYGPLLDRFGRKKPLYAGMILFLLSSVGCIVSTSAGQLVFFRVLQGLGGCAGMVASRTLVRDLFAVSQNAKIFSLLMLVIGISPIIAPTLGGYIVASAGWRYIFLFLAGFGVLVLCSIYFMLPEGRKADPSVSLRPAPIVRNFITVLKVPQFYTFSFTGGVGASGLYAYIAASPVVFMKHFGVSEQVYGMIFGGAALSLILASQLNRVLVNHLPGQEIIKRALFIQSAVGMLFFGLALSGYLALWTCILLICIFLACQGFTFPNTSALSLAPFSRMAGSASALMGGIQMIIGTAVSAFVGFLTVDSALPMAGAMAACALLSLAILLGGSRRIRYRADEETTREASTIRP